MGRKEAPWDERDADGLRYGENWSLTLDLVIMVKTIKAVGDWPWAHWTSDLAVAVRPVPGSRPLQHVGARPPRPAAVRRAQVQPSYFVTELDPTSRSSTAARRNNRFAGTSTPATCAAHRRIPGQKGQDQQAEATRARKPRIQRRYPRPRRTTMNVDVSSAATTPMTTLFIDRPAG